MGQVNRVAKGWGHELIFASNNRYCGKLLNFETGKRFSMHFHRYKDETWYVLTGKYSIRYIDTKDASVHDRELSPGDVWRNEPCLPHQVVCLESGSIVEVSTPDGVEDNYRVFPGDSQKWSREA